MCFLVLQRLPSAQQIATTSQKVRTLYILFHELIRQLKLTVSQYRIKLSPIPTLSPSSLTFLVLDCLDLIFPKPKMVRTRLTLELCSLVELAVTTLHPVFFTTESESIPVSLLWPGSQVSTSFQSMLLSLLLNPFFLRTIFLNFNCVLWGLVVYTVTIHPIRGSIEFILWPHRSNLLDSVNLS